MAKRSLILALSLTVVALGILASLALAAPSLVASPASLAAGGQIYDKWWKAAGVAEPTGDHPLWATQTTNTRTGLDTWRCKECHGWDYLGKDGAYGSGSHKTGFVGVSDAGKSKTVEQIIAILKGGSNPKHDFSAQLDNTALTNLANFLKEGLYDTKATIDYATKKPKSADATRGQKPWVDNCSGCHGADGTKVNFGTATEPVFIGTLALDNPQEVLHKIRAGQPAMPAMPSGFAQNWTLQNEADVLAYLQSLPAKAPAAPAAAASPLAAGGQIYDKWWKAVGAAEPKGDHPLWATQTTNTRTGLDTWRCKECHGWDYLGKDGAYGSGSHKTGFVGVSDAGKSKTVEQIIAILKGGSNPKHDFSAQLDNTALTNLASFLKEGLYDTKATIDYTTKKPKSADATRGQKPWVDNCSGCHGADGTKVNFGTATEPVFIGTLALDNPQEVLHKIRAGQPALPAMPSGFGQGWTLQNEADVLAHLQTLPTKAPAAPADAASLAAGGQIYDKWWKAIGAAEPKGDHPLWATQTTNTRTGLDTWRCKECHGWDYLGKDGAYGSGSHKTGFVGVSEAGKSKTVEQIIAILKGASNPKHDFSAQLDNTALTNLANFLKEGLYDTKATIDYTTKKPTSADATRGQKPWVDNCSGCHGADGTKVNFGTATEPVFIGTLALDNPQEVLHKIRAGQPALPAMPSGFGQGWTLQNEADVLAYLQTLPTKAPAAPVVTVLPKTGEASPPLLALALVGLGLVAVGWVTRRAFATRNL